MFYSRNPAFRSPTGAVPEKTPVHFKISMPRNLRCSAVRLLVRSDKTGKEEQLGMFWCGMDGSQAEWWECHYTPPEPGLYFYRFSTDTWRGTLPVSRSWGDMAAIRNGAMWQLTVYSKDFETPDWLAGGIIYQIFPDRFYRSGEKKEGVPSDRAIHEEWGGVPEWRPDAQGKITNRDYFGGDLAGIERKLAYLKSLGVTCLYLNPIFEANSNHRYDTADYTRIDPLLGTEEDFRSLCESARRLNIHVILDGVFNHTGSDSVYFNREGRYPGPGAFQSQESSYSQWYHFRHWPDSYDCWWDFITLPCVDECNPSYGNYINGPDGVIRKWLRAGASGWRLDVADELPDSFLDSLRAAAKAEKPDAVIVGEVWEDASNKIAYGSRRRYLLGGQLDSVMNYPFRSAVIGFLTGAKPADMMEQILSIVENYPPQTLRLLMNNIGTHDTERALTALAGEPLRGRSRSWQSEARLTAQQRERGLRLMRLAALMQYTLPGVPCVYYGDEAGMEGYRDPFNRACYPWGHEDEGLLAWYRRLGALRATCSCLKEGGFQAIAAGGSVMAYIREDESTALLCAFNNASEPSAIQVPEEWRRAVAFCGSLPDETDRLSLEPLGCAALILRKPKTKAAETSAAQKGTKQE